MSGKHARPYDNELEAARILTPGGGTTAHGRHRRVDEPCCIVGAVARRELGNSERSDRA
ncbi:hypothetical protein [Agrococcus jejuensis]|uniref:hypothetical protein n=1 Tax=Agrococcus jejuensis TaxID=399736 RepID=UPI0016429227|nr:hypothetical protein [Agrococcus jejuensis]